ncbi:Maf family nucleotide pyrophosphatase [Apibacter raozihei]|uniref:Maf family nucleotide pyrophosphatase n=1 Tax=Apibacter raozihei TaxID=2500547 RepID=UPI000FE38167|nr:Maf family nucleotide pyrophosphatase [Apibacter raozihei]
MYYQIVLASQSPRRKELLKSLGYEFDTISLNIDESYPGNLKAGEITEYLAYNKSKSYGEIPEKTILITADTIVWYNNKALEKPNNSLEAENMLKSLSGHSHEVFTSVGFSTKDNYKVFTDSARVHFLKLDKEEINYYVNNFNPMDKAGSYGIQDWIGLSKIEKIEGSYFTIMGFPTHLVYNYLKSFE